MPSDVLHGLKVVAVVAQAVWEMARNLCPDAPRITLMAAATCLVVLVPSAWSQVGVIALAAILGLLLFKPQQGAAHEPLPIATRPHGRPQAALLGVNAAVVGLLLAALYQPVWTSAIHSPQDFGLALVALVALMFWKLPPWLVVVGSGVAGGLLSTVL